MTIRILGKVWAHLSGRHGVGLAVTALTIALFIYQAREHAFIGDDAFISFRYARHLVDGHGLVWNVGERVEGYTNFLWVLLMAASIGLGFDPQQVASVVGTASGVGVLWIVGRLAARLYGSKSVYAYVPALALAGNEAFAEWSTGGLETQFFSLLAIAAVFRLVVERHEAERRPLSAVLFGLAALTRPEGVLLGGVAALAVLLAGGGDRRPLARTLRWAWPFGMIVLSHLLWRRLYYGFFLPNTFYAKVPGLWWEQGAHYYRLLFDDTGYHWLAPLAVAGLLARPSFAHALSGMFLGVYGLYVMCVGGDRFGLRFFVPVMPYFVLLATAGLEALTPKTLVDARHRRASRVLAASFSAALLLSGTTAVGDPGKDDRHGIASVDSIHRYARFRIRQGQTLRKYVDHGILPSDLRIAVGGAGALPYFTMWPTVDYRGLNDVRIAHEPLARRGVIAHERMASVEYLRERGVEAFDVMNGFVQRSGRQRVGTYKRKALKRLRKLDKRAKGRAYAESLRFECFKLSRRHVFVFATPLGREEIEKRLHSLARCRS